MNEGEEMEVDMPEHLTKRKQFDDVTLEQWFDARLRPDVATGQRLDDECAADNARVVAIVQKCREGEHGDEASRLIERLSRQAKDFSALQKDDHDVQNVDLDTCGINANVHLRAWHELQLTMAALEKHGVDWGNAQESQVAAVLLSMG